MLHLQGMQDVPPIGPYKAGALDFPTELPGPLVPLHVVPILQGYPFCGVISRL